MNLHDALILAQIIVLAITAVASILGAFQTRKTHQAVNSRMSEMLRLARASAAAAAVLGEKEAERLRQKAKIK